MLVELQRVGTAVYIVGPSPLAGCSGVVIGVEADADCYDVELSSDETVHCVPNVCLRIDRRHNTCAGKAQKRDA